jgi:hypothetical protein
VECRIDKVRLSYRLGKKQEREGRKEERKKEMVEGVA